MSTLVIYETGDRILVTTKDKEQELIDHLFIVGGIRDIGAYKRWETQTCGVFIHSLTPKHALLSAVSCRECKRAISKTS